jgi:hypothetical protein
MCTEVVQEGQECYRSMKVHDYYKGPVLQRYKCTGVVKEYRYRAGVVHGFKGTLIVQRYNGYTRNTVV